MAYELLWITPKWVFPAEDGARVATRSLLRSLTRSGVTIDLLAMHGPREKPDEKFAIGDLGVRSARGFRRAAGDDLGMRKKFRLMRAWLCDPGTPITLQPYHDKACRVLIDRMLERPYSHLVFDGLHPAAVFSRCGIFALPKRRVSILYRAHNCETLIWDRAVESASSPIKSRLLRYQAARVRAFERSVIENCDGVAAISSEDRAAFDALSKRAKAHYSVVPIGFEPVSISPLPARPEIELLFLGRLDWPPNREGLQWFLKEVWPAAAAQRTDLKLTIAGSGDSSWLSEHLPMTRVNFIGRAPDVTALYASCSAAIVPIFYGGGTRVKAIEAAAFGRPCISTALGVEGIGLQPGAQYIHGADAAEWRSALNGLTAAAMAQIGAAARARVNEKFSATACAAKFVELLHATDAAEKDKVFGN